MLHCRSVEGFRPGLPSHMSLLRSMLIEHHCWLMSHLPALLWLPEGMRRQPLQKMR